MKTDKQREGSFETERVKSLPPGSVQTLGQNYNEREREKRVSGRGLSLMLVGFMRGRSTGLRILSVGF